MIKEGGRTTGRADSYLKQFQALIRKPAETIQSQNFSLKELIDWEKVKSCPLLEEHPSPSLADPSPRAWQSFHLLQPITNDSYIKSLLVRLGNEKMPLAQGKINLLSKQGDKEPSLHFYMCSCGRYRHYARPNPNPNPIPIPNLNPNPRPNLTQARTLPYPFSYPYNLSLCTPKPMYA